MFELENSYFDITPRSWRFCQMWYFGYHGFEAILQLSTGRNSMRTFQHGSSSYRLSLDESRHSTQLTFQAASKLDLVSTLSLPPERVLFKSPTPNAKECPDLHSSTRVRNSAGKFDESKTEDGITDEECSDIEIEKTSLPKIKREICRADLTGDQVFLCCMPRPAVQVDQLYKMQASSDDDGLDPVRRKLPIQIHKWADLYDREKAEFGDLPPH